MNKAQKLLGIIEGYSMTSMANPKEKDAIDLGDGWYILWSEENADRAEIEIGRLNSEGNPEDVNVVMVDDIPKEFKKLGFKLNTSDPVYTGFMQDSFGFVPK